MYNSYEIKSIKQSSGMQNCMIIAYIGLEL